jgi:hypothetical protein
MVMHIASITPTSNGLSTPPAITSPVEVSIINSLVFVRKSPARQRAQIAAHWAAGEYDIQRTVANATAIFAVNRPYVSAARNGGNSKPASCSAGPRLEPRELGAADRFRPGDRGRDALRIRDRPSVGGG